MTSLEANTHAFVVRVWREEGGHMTWRGHITHVLSGRRSSFNNLESILTIITSFLAEDGANTRLLNPEKNP